MRKYLKKVFIFTLTIIITGCIPFQNKYFTDPFEVKCNWEIVNQNIKQINLESIGLQISPDYIETEKNINLVSFTNFTQEPQLSNNVLHVEVSYGAIISNTYEDYTKNGPKYYTTPMIQIQIWLPHKNEFYTAIYDIKGLLVSESGNYFMDGGKPVQKLFCQIRAEYFIKALGL